MALVELKAGATVDLATGQDLQAAVQKIRQDMVLPATPRRLNNTQIVPAGFTSPFVIDLTGPSDAVVWDVRSVVLVGADAFTAVANVNGAIFVGQKTGSGGLGLVDVAAVGLTVPSQSTLNAQAPVLHRQRLYVALSGSGLAAGQSYTVTAMVIEVQAEDAPRYFG